MLFELLPQHPHSARSCAVLHCHRPCKGPDRLRYQRKRIGQMSAHLMFPKGHPDFCSQHQRRHAQAVRGDPHCSAAMVDGGLQPGTVNQVACLEHLASSRDISADFGAASHAKWQGSRIERIIIKSSMWLDGWRCTCCSGLVLKQTPVECASRTA